jgi:hypothetical protein
LSIIITAFIERWETSLFAQLAEPPWRVTQRAGAHVLAAINTLTGDYTITDHIAVHRTATNEPGSIVKASGETLAKNARVGRMTLLDQYPKSLS